MYTTALAEESEFNVVCLASQFTLLSPLRFVCSFLKFSTLWVIRGMDYRSVTTGIQLRAWTVSDGWCLYVGRYIAPEIYIEIPVSWEEAPGNFMQSIAAIG